MNLDVCCRYWGWFSTSVVLLRGRRLGHGLKLLVGGCVVEGVRREWCGTDTHGTHKRFNGSEDEI